jgi:microcompartment protein CcmL/EutN
VRRAIGVIEFSSIARGIETTDRMLKAAQVTLLKSSTVCPGKYLTILDGRVEDIQTAVDTGLREGGEYVVDTLEIPNIHEQLIPAIVQTNPVERPEAVGVMEFYSVTAGILAADAAAKAARVTLIEVKIGYAIGGKGVVLLTGDLEAVKTAIGTACSGGDQLLQVSVIARPDPNLLESLL